MQRSGHCLLFILLVGLSACRGAAAPIASASPAPDTLLPTAPLPGTFASTPPISPIASASTPAMIQPPIPSPSSTNPIIQGSPVPLTPTSRAPSTIPITPQNASGLVEFARREFSPWDQILAIRWSPDGTLLAVAAGDAIYLLDAATLTEKRKLTPGVATPGLDFSPDGRSLAAGGRDGMLYVWQMDSASIFHEHQAHQKSISSLAYSPNGKMLATAGYDAIARLWETGNFQSLGEIIGGSYAIPSVTFTPDSANLAIVNSNVIRLREVTTRRIVISIIADESIYSVAISPDGKYLASGDVNNGVRIWDMTAPPGPGGEIGVSLHDLRGHTGGENRPEALVWQVSYSPDGLLLASAGGDAKTCVWQANNGKLLATLSGHTRAVTSAAFSPDGYWLATGGLDGRLIVWGVGVP